MSELLLVRHGQASLGADNYDQLSEKGIRQSRVLGEYIAERSLGFDFLLTGTLERHRQTLDEMSAAAGLGGTDRGEHAGLNEYDFHSICRIYGELNEGDPLWLAAQANPGDARAFYRLLRKALMAWSEGALPGTPETYAQFVDRVRGVGDDIRRRAGRGARVLAISSGGAISQFIGCILGLSPGKVVELNLQARNTGVTHFFFNEHKYNLLQFNGIAHLDHPQHIELVSF